MIVSIGGVALGSAFPWHGTAMRTGTVRMGQMNTTARVSWHQHCCAPPFFISRLFLLLREKGGVMAVNEERDLFLYFTDSSFFLHMFVLCDSVFWVLWGVRLEALPVSVCLCPSLWVPGGVCVEQFEGPLLQYFLCLGVTLLHRLFVGISSLRERVVGIRLLIAVLSRWTAYQSVEN